MKSGFEVKELLKSWDIKRLVELTFEEEEVLKDLLKALKSPDKRLQIRALTVLLEVVMNSNWKTRKKVLENGFDEITELAKSEDDRVSERALQVLRYLLKNNPLTDGRLKIVLEALLEKANSKNPLLWENIVKVAETVRVPYLAPKSTQLLIEALRRGTPEETAVASTVLLSSGALTREEWKLLVKRTADLLESGSPLLIEAGLNVALKLTKLPIVYPMDVVVKHILPSLRRLISTYEDQFIKVKAMEVFDRLRETVIRYYRLHPREAQRTAEELTRLGLVEEAYLISPNANSSPGLIHNDRLFP